MRILRASRFEPSCSYIVHTHDCNPSNMDPHPLQDTSFDSLFEPLDDIFGRKQLVSITSRTKPNRFIVLPFSTVLLDGINPLALFHKSLISGRAEICKQLAPILSRQDIKSQFGIAWQYPVKPLSLSLCNAKSANNSIRSASIIGNHQSSVKNNSCQCNTAYPHLIDPTIGHVRGMGAKFTSDLQSQRCISKGLNYRPPGPPCPTEAMATMQLFWEKTLTYTTKLYGGDGNEVDKAKKRFLSYCKTSINLELKRVKKVTSTTTLNEHSLEFAKTNLAITKVDKAAHTIAWECKQFHQRTLWGRVTEGPNFKRVHVPIDTMKTTLVATVLSHTSQWLKPAIVPTELAYITSTIKFHKEPIAYRFLTPMHNCAIAPISKLIGAASQFLLTSTWAELCHQGEMHILNKYGVQTRLNWKASSMQEHMLNLPPTVTSLWGCDIDQCYEKPPLFDGENSLCAAMESFLKECFKYEADKAGCIQHLWFKTKRGKGVKDDDYITILGFSKCSPFPSSKQVHKLKLDYLLRLVRVLLENIIIQVGDALFQQVIGFPMGCHPSSNFCDIWFGTKEYCFIWKCVLNGELDMARGFHHAMRYQDDVSILNNHLAMQHFDPSKPHLWIYPMGVIAIKDTTLKYSTINGITIGVEMTFLSARLTLEHTENGTSTLHTKRYEKVRELPFDTIKFTHRTSCVPSNSLYNVIGGQLTTNAMVSSHLEYFLDEIHVLMAHLLDNALIKRKIKHTMEQWATNKAPTLPLQFDVSEMQLRLSNLLTSF